MESHKIGDPRVQDAYSLRCMPQVHGAARDAFAHARAVLEREMNSSTDNPLVFAGRGDILSGGNFHGAPVGLVLDYAAIAATDLASIAERRIEKLVNPALSELPAFLVREGGLHSGFMMAHVTAAALVSECKVLAHPASVDTIPTSANQEDHVSMGVTAARKCAEIAANTETVLALEWLCACQAREFHRELRAGKGAEAAYACLRTRVAPLGRDRFLHADIESARELLRSGALVAAVNGAVGELLA
jgi:histidine ammonia-lyase